MVKFARLRTALGIPDDYEPEVEPVEGEEYMRHDAFEAQTDAEGKTRYPEATDCEGTLRIQDSSGTLWPCVCDVCGFEVGIQMARIDPNRLLEHKIGKAGLPEAFVGKTFEPGDAEQEPTLQACRQWLRTFRPGVLGASLPAVALWGKPGRGKSHLLSLMIETLIKKHGVDAMYRSATDLLDELQAGIDQQTYEVQWQRVLRVPVLALDDLGAGRWTDWRRDRFATLVDHRYSKELPLLVATNVPPPGWDRAFGERSASRLRGMALRFELAGRDRRESAQQTFEDAA